MEGKKSTDKDSDRQSQRWGGEGGGGGGGARGKIDQRQYEKKFNGKTVKWLEMHASFFRGPVSDIPQV